jgi:hypothetical protein
LCFNFASLRNFFRNRRAMKPLAAMRTDRTERAALLGSESRPSRFSRQRLTPNYRPSASQAFPENDAKDSSAGSYAITWGILKPNIYHKAHNFAPGRIRPELSRQEPRRLLSAGRRAMKANSVVFQSTPGRGRRRACGFWSGPPKSAFSLNRPDARKVGGASWEG